MPLIQRTFNEGSFTIAGAEALGAIAPRWTFRPVSAQPIIERKNGLGTVAQRDKLMPLPLTTDRLFQRSAP